VQASLVVCLCVVTAVCPRRGLAGSAARLATPLWAWLVLVGLRHRYRCTAGLSPLPWRRCCGGPTPCRPYLAVVSPLGRWLPWSCWHDTAWARRATGERVLSRWGNSPSLLHLPSQLPRPELGDLAIPLCFFFRHRRHGPASEPHPVSSASRQFAIGVGLQQPGPPPRPCS
jgi:hypothetical protein